MYRSRLRLQVIVFALALLVLPALWGCATQDKTMVSVNGEKVTKGQLDNRLEGQAGKATLQQMVDTALVLQYGKQQNISITDKEIQDQLNQLEQRFPPGQFETILKNQGLSLDDAKNIERVQLIVKKAVDNQIAVSDAQIADFFNKNQSLYSTPAQVRARHILVKTKADADSIEVQLRGGANFATLATKFSVDPGSKAAGGELGWFGSGQMVKPFSDAAFAMSVGQISQPVQSPFGWHIIQLEGKRPPHSASLAEATPKVRAMLVQQQEAAQGGPFIEQLRSKASIQVYDDRFNPLFPPPTGAASPAPVATGKGK